MIWRKGYKAKDIHISLALSIAAHLCVVVLLAGLYGESRRNEQVIIADLTLVAGHEKQKAGPSQHPGRAGSKGGAVMAKGRAEKEPAPERKPVAAKPEAEPEPKTPVPSEAVLRVASLSVDTAAHGILHGESWGRRGRESTGSGHGAGPGGETGQKGGEAGSGGNGGGGDSAGGQGLLPGSDYYYIRQTVMKNIRYPERARRMGQEGRVVLSFIVLESGATSDVRVVASCGFRLLDESAKEGVANTTIPRKVPYRVVVTLPVTYRLQ